jgi:uncharacterized membrane protein
MMTHAEDRPTLADRFMRRSTQLLLANVAAFGFWQLTDAVHDATPGNMQPVLRGLSLAAWAVWAILLLVLLRDQRALKNNPTLRAAVHDERAREIRLRAYRAGFWAALTSAALLAIADAANLLPAHAAARFVVVMGVTAFIAAYVAFDRE